MLLTLKDKIHLPCIEAENTATIVWNFLAERRLEKTARKNVIPVFWNSYPFHPHPAGQRSKNRAPTKDEIVFGCEILKELYEIYEPKVVAGIGQKGAAALKNLFPGQKIQTIRHPSYGGKEQFIEGMNNLFDQA